jgi:hypothetical protein
LGDSGGDEVTNPNDAYTGTCEVCGKAVSPGFTHCESHRPQMGAPRLESVAYYHVEPQKFVVAHCPMCKGTGLDNNSLLLAKPLCPFCEGGHVITYPEQTWTLTTASTDDVTP